MYKVEITNNNKYELELDAQTGEILQWEQELMD